MRDHGLIKTHSIKQNYKTVMTGYEDGKLLRMKGTVIPRKHDFAAIVESENSPIRLWHSRYGRLNFGSLSQLQKK